MQTRAQRTPCDARILLGGMPKAGKTTLLAEWAPETTVIVDTHGGTLDLPGEHYVSHVRDWLRFVRLVDEIVAGRHPFRTIGLDLADDLYTFGDQFVSARKGVAAAQLVEYGKGEAETTALFRRQIGRLFDSPYGIWLLAHTEVEEVANVSRFVPRLHKRVRSWLTGLTSYVWLIEAAGPTRVLHTQPTTRFEAGSRTPMPSPMQNPTALDVYAAMEAGASGRPVAASPPAVVAPPPASAA